MASAKGYAATEAKEVFSRARALSRNIGNETLLFQSLAGLWSFHLIRGELHPALEVAREMLQLAERIRNPGVLLNGHMAIGLPLFYLGQFPAAHDHLEKSSSYHGREKDPPGVSIYGWEPGVLSLVTRLKLSGCWVIRKRLSKRLRRLYNSLESFRPLLLSLRRWATCNLPHLSWRPD